MQNTAITSERVATIERLDSGLTLIVEEMPEFESVAYELQIPGGVVSDRAESIGQSLLLGEMLSRGAGELDSRELSDAFDRLGIRYAAGSASDRFFIRANLLSQHLEEALNLTSLILLKPSLPAEHLDSVKSLLLQDILSLKDNPARLASIELAKRYYPEPYNRSILGQQDSLEKCNVNDLRQLWQDSFKPDGAVLSVAGKVNRDQIKSLLNKYFAKWSGQAVKLPAYNQFPKQSKYHINFDSAQLQILLSYPSAKFADPFYYEAKLAAGVMSGGMFGRLFIEVREKRGLCYSVSLRHSANQHYGVVTTYAGTTPDRADQTLEVILSELVNVKGSVTQEELRRAKANLKAQMIIAEELPVSRASSNAGDWFISGKVRTLDQIAFAIDKVTLESLDQYFSRYTSSEHTLLTLGSREI